MAEIIQGTTPCLEVKIPDDIDLEEITALNIDIYQGDLVIDKGLNDVFFDSQTNLMYIPLTEEETLSFSATVANVQMRYTVEGVDSILGTNPYPFRIIPLRVHRKFYE